MLCNSSYAQTVSLTSPTSNTEVKEGDDFATDVLGDPWDFNERRDIAWEQFFEETTVGVSNGIWSGNNSSAGAGNVQPLFGGLVGFYNSLTTPGDRSLPKYGNNHPVDTSKYTHISYRLDHSQRSTQVVYWEGNTSQGNYFVTGSSPRLVHVDSLAHQGTRVARSGFHIYSFDLTNLSQFDQSSGSWSGNPFTIRIDPSISGTAGATTAIDWIRLVDPDSAPNHTIAWNSSGITSDTVVTVYVDNNNSGQDGTPLKQFADGNNPGTYTFPTAILPPGDYYFYVGTQQVSGGSAGSSSFSGYSGRLRVNGKPTLVVNAPSIHSGEEYSSSALNNVWDMASIQDVENLNRLDIWPDAIWRQFTGEQFIDSSEAQQGGKVFQAAANAPLSGNTESDVQVHLNVPTSAAIITNKWRYLTTRMWVDPTLYGDINDKVARGWLLRTVFWSNIINGDGGTSRGIIVNEGWHEYTFDLWDTNVLETGIPWLNVNTLTNLRLDPLENDVATLFQIDFAQLHSENVAENSYNIQYSVSDTDSSNITASFYFDTDNSGFNGTLIGSDTVGPGNHTYNWNTSRLAEGTYWVYIVVNDGLNQHQWYGNSPVRIGMTTTQPPSNKALLDYDGDGSSDLMVYRGAGSVFLGSLSNMGFSNIFWGGPTFDPVRGDFDGDGITDYGLLTDIGGNLFWYAYFSSNDFLYAPASLGVTGDQVVVADYNGDGADEMAVYTPSLGRWTIQYSTGERTELFWGDPTQGDIAVPSDFDGDGKADITVWRKATAQWFAIRSTDGSVITQQWGLGFYDDVPLANFDADGDGKADFVVCRQGRFPRANAFAANVFVDIGSGGCYILNSVTNAVESIWGTPGLTLDAHNPWLWDEFFVTDFNGDGVLDISLYRAQTGEWYTNQRNGTGVTLRGTWGLAGDRIPRKLR